LRVVISANQRRKKSFSNASIVALECRIQACFADQFIVETQNVRKPEVDQIMRNEKRDQAVLLAELLLEDGEEFVEAAYMALLKRRPDATGGRIYLRALRNGTNKLQVLYELSVSDDCRRAGGDIPGLKEAFAREKIGQIHANPIPAPPVEATQIARAEQLLLIDDYSQLIEVAYWVLLKRAPDPEGITNYLERLNSGARKAQFLHELFTSTECRNIGVEVPGLREIFAREGLDVVEEIMSSTPDSSPEVATTLAMLLELQGGRFVESAYMTLLKRQPDIHGYQYRLRQLMNGDAKIQILGEIAASKEAIEVGADLPGLQAALRRYNLSQLPIVGRFVRIFADIEGTSTGERRGRVAEQRLLTLEVELVERLDHLATVVTSATAVVESANADRQNADNRIASLERSVASLRQLIEQDLRLRAVSAPPAPRVDAAKSASRLILDLRAEEIARDLR
jgi:hypothetical protein